MKPKTHLQGTAVLILLLFSTFSIVSAQNISGNTTTITAGVSGAACGNTGGTNTNCTGPNVPSSSDTRNIIDNQVIIQNGGSISGNAYGGYTRGNGQVSGNKAFINGTVTGNVYGGNIDGAGSGTVTGNSVIIDSGGTANGDVYGGATRGSGTVTGNSVTINNGGTADRHVYGGSSSYGEVNNNLVNIGETGTIKGNVYGGAATGVTSTKNAINNAVIISGHVTGVVIGATNAGAGDVINNTVSVSGTVEGRVTGGQIIGNGAVTGNTVHIGETAFVGGYVSGGNGYGGTVSGNIADISGTVKGNAYGGYTSSSRSTGTITGNTVTVNSTGSIGGSAYGGYTTGAGNVIGNVITIAGMVTGNVYGGYTAGAGTITGNTVTVNSTGSIGGSAYGGYTTGAGDVIGNIITIAGMVTGNVYGGYTAGAGLTAGNTVNLLQGATIAGGVYGGNTTGSGNILNIQRFRGNLAEINHFDHYNFDLPDNLVAGNTLITITGDTSTDLTGSRITLSKNISPTAFHQSGDEIILISKAHGPFSSDPLDNIQGGLSKLYTLSLNSDSGALLIRAEAVETNPQTKVLAYGIISEILSLNRAADLISNTGLKQAETAALMHSAAGPALFGSLSYANTRTKTGSHIDADGWAGLLGLSWKPDRAMDDSGWLAGVFIEGGQGNYSTFNAFGSQNPVTTSGDTDYIGGGIAAHYRFQNRIKLEGAARFGRVKSDFEAKGYAGALRPRFNLDSNYYGAHVGISHDRDLREKLNLDLSAKYLWTRREGETARIVGERVRFDDINSHRIRLGGRLTYEGTARIKTFAGIYGEYEFDGKSTSRNLTASIDHYPLRIRGGTAIGELGMRFSPDAYRRVHIDVALYGHAGRRDGIIGNLSLRWNF